MAEEAGTNVQEATSQSQPDASQNGNSIPPELAEQMELSLNGGVPREKIEGTDTGNGQAAVIETAQQLAIDPFGVLKEKFGYENHDAAIKEIEELRVLKATPPQPTELKFENEQSEKLFKALQAGKTAEVYEALSQQHQLNSLTEKEVNKDTAAEIIKLGMQLKYKDLTPAEIDYKFNKQFSIPKEPVQGDSELDEDFEERRAVWKEQVADIEINKIIEAKFAKPELESAKSKIVFPETPASVDEGYLQYKKSLEEQPKIAAEMEEIYKTFTPESIETKVKFIDEPNKIDFEFQYKPDGESFKKSVEMSLNPDKFFDIFRLPDGKFDNKRFLDAIYFATNKDKILTEAMNQSKNATIKSFLPDNSQSGTQRQFPQTQELSELDKQMKASLAGYS